MVAISRRASVLVSAVAIAAGCKGARERDTATCEAAKVQFSVEYLKKDSDRSADAVRTQWQNLKRIAEEGQRACAAIGDAEAAANLGNSVQVANELLKKVEEGSAAAPSASVEGGGRAPAR